MLYSKSNSYFAELVELTVLEAELDDARVLSKMS